jgi:predicted Zn finger-like uncharacterized protein
MIVTCPKCASRYEVDSSTISDRGTYAHCSNCENIFFIKKRKKISQPVETDFSRTNQSSEKTEDPPKTTVAQFPAEVEKSKYEPRLEKVQESIPTPKAETQKLENALLSEPANPSFGQDDINALFGGVVADGKPESPAPAVPVVSDGTAQGDIDAPLSGIEVGGAKLSNASAAPHKPVETPSEPFAGFGQDDIDALFGGLVAEAKPETPAPAARVVSASSAPAAPGAAADGTISQADLDSLLLGAVPQKGKDRPTKAGVPELSQDDPDSLLAGGVEGDISATGAEGGQPAPTKGEPPSAVSEETMRSLLTEEGDGMASLFEEAVDAGAGDQTRVVAATPAATSAEAEAAKPRQTVEPLVQTEAEQERPASAGAKQEESKAKEAFLKRLGKRRLPKLSKKQKLVAVSIAASAALAFVGEYLYRMAGEQPTAKSEEKRVAPARPKQGAEVAAVKPAAQPDKKIGPEPAQKPETEVKRVEAEKPEPAVSEAKTEPSPPITAQPRAVGANISFGIIVPVDFNAQMVKVMTADVEVTFASDKDKKYAERRRFLYELEIEKEIASFFKDKFYEDTHYARDKLAAYLFDRVKKRRDLGRVTEINLENFDVR